MQWKQGAVIYMMLYTSLSYNTTPIHSTPLPLHPPAMNTQLLLLLLLLVVLLICIIDLMANNKKYNIIRNMSLIM